MNRKLLLVAAGLVVLGGGAALYFAFRPSSTLVLTGIVTTNDVVVSPQISGQVSRLLVSEGDSVAQNQLIAVLQPAELAADQTFYSHSAQAVSSQVEESQADLQYQETAAAQQLRQAQAAFDGAAAQATEDSATEVNSRVLLKRLDALYKAGGISPQQFDSAQTAYTVAQSRLQAARQNVQAQQAAVALAHAAEDQVAARRSALIALRQQQAAAVAQTRKASVRLGYTEIRAPMAGYVDTRVVRAGEFVNAGQPIVTLVNPDSLWVRADVEETYIDRVRLGDTLTVRLPSGAERQGVVFYRAVDAEYATQRDVSRTKRDIKTFEIRLRVNNKDRRLAVGMTAYVLLPLAKVRP